MNIYIPRFELLTHAEDLDRVASVPVGTVDWVLGSSLSELYTRYDIPKRDRARGHRTVWKVNDEQWARGLRVLNRHLRDYLIERRKLPRDAAHGYSVGRSIITNARVHLGAPVIVRADIADFFNTITLSRIVDVLVAAGLEHSIARIIATLCCVNDRLALGLAPSPTLANVVAAGIDDLFENKFKTRTELRYTRYADDMTFSGSAHEVPSEAEIGDVLASEGFLLAPGKYRQKKRGQAVLVTGLSVFGTDCPRVPKRFKRKIRQELHYIERFGLWNHCNKVTRDTSQGHVNRLDGRIQYLRGVEPDLGHRLNSQWQRQLQAAEAHVSWDSYKRTNAPATIFVDESVVETITKDDNGIDSKINVISIAMVIVRDAQSIRDQLVSFARELRKDWRHAGTGGKHLPDGVLHYTDLSEDVRAEMAKMLELMPLRAFVAYDQLSSNDAYVEIWLRLYRSLLRRRFSTLDGADVRFVVEENPRVSLNQIRRATLDEYEPLIAKGARRPLQLKDENVVVVSKTDDAGIWLPDMMLGFFHDYARARGGTKRKKVAPEQRPAVETRFERVRDKIRMIKSMRCGTHWGNKHPFQPWPDGRPF